MNERSGSDADELGVTLDDRSIPVDPERVARALGAAIRDRHAIVEHDPALGSVSMAALASRLRDAAERAGDPAVENGPYLGRSTLTLAEVAEQTVSALPPSTQPAAMIRFGLRLSHARMTRDGTVEIDGPFMVGDRELELAAAAVALGGRHGPAVVAPLFDAYGLDQLDLRRLDTCQLLVSIATELGVDPDHPLS